MESKRPAGKLLIDEGAGPGQTRSKRHEVWEWARERERDGRKLPAWAAADSLGLGAWLLSHRAATRPERKEDG